MNLPDYVRPFVDWDARPEFKIQPTLIGEWLPEYYRQRFQDLIKINQVRLQPLPASLTGVVPLFRPPDSNLIVKWQESLLAYQSQMRDSQLEPWPYPVRVAQTEVTGLPAFLNGYLQPGEIVQFKTEPASAALDWLLREDGTKQALFGTLSTETLRQQLKYPNVTRIPEFSPLAAEARNIGLPEAQRTLIHVRYQQFYGDLPVLGGGVTVQALEDDPRAATIGGYLPIDATPPEWGAPIAEVEAIRIAEEALADLALTEPLDSTDKIRISQMALRRWLRAGGELDQPWRREVAMQLTRLLAPADTVGSAASLPTDALHDRLTYLLAQANDRPWQKLGEGVVVRHPERPEEDKRWVFPFAGQYYQIFWVEFTTAARDAGWRVFVDASDGVVLGAPERMTAHSLDVRERPGALPVVLADAGAADVSDYCGLRWHPGRGGGDVDVTAIAAKASVDTTDPEREAANIAYHARQMIDYFAKLCGDPTLHNVMEIKTRAAPYFDILAGMTGSSGALEMGFTPAAVGTSAVSFQTGKHLRVGLRQVDDPSLDPEVIYHEIAHVLMWLMNSEPFIMPSQTHPFARALAEGYAMYFARALSVQRGDDKNQPWARAAYSSFGARYDVVHDYAPPGGGQTYANRLGAPNLYPPQPLQDPDAVDLAGIRNLILYDIGMIWARTLWSVREFVAQELGVLYAPLVDQWALESYIDMPGWVANFEIAAENLIDRVRKHPILSAQTDRVIDFFAARNLLAGRGVLALLDTGGQVLAGTSQGICRSPDNGQTWSAWEQVTPGEGARALLADDAGHVYAASERGIYQQNGAAWDALGVWPAQQIPLCLATGPQGPYVGTAQGVFFRSPGGNWESWNPANKIMKDLVLDLAFAQDGGRVYGFVANLRTPVRRFIDPSTNSDIWEPVVNAGSPLEGQTGASTAVAVQGATAFMGTYAHGIWRLPALEDLESWQQIARPQDIGHGVVLALRVHGAALYAATTTGLWLGTLHGAAWNWSNTETLGVLPGQASVTAVLPLAAADLCVGTANDGLWVRRGGVWTQHSGIGR